MNDMAVLETVDIEERNRQAIEILRTNDRGGYNIPTAGLYPYQWNWDSAFAAWGWSEIDLARAWTELETLFKGQWSTGMVPHIIFHEVDEGYFPGPNVWGTHKSPQTSGITQPPVAATMARKIFEKDPTAGRAPVERLFKAMGDWHRWFIESRGESGAIAITHPWESGRDNALDWEKAAEVIDTTNVGEYQRRDTSHVNPEMRPRKIDYDRYLALVYLGRDVGWDETKIREQSPFRVADVGMTFILLRACRDLAWLADQIGQPRKEIDTWIAHLEKGCEQLWNAELGCYDSLDLKTGKLSGTKSVGSFLCWFAGVEPRDSKQSLEGVLSRAPYSIPSLDPASSRFDAKRYWLGPTWPVVNSIVGLGLQEQGETVLAERVRKDTYEMIMQTGFYEYFNPMTAAGEGGNNFTWTAAVWLAWVTKGLEQ